VLVMKFGGTSLGDKERIDTVVALVRSRLPRKPLVVCSAHAGVTDLLLEGARAAVAGKPSSEAVRAREAGILAALRLRADLVEPELERLDEMYRGVALLGELTPRSLDMIAALGERMSVKAIAAVLRRRRIPATAVNADEAGLVTDGRYMRASPLPSAYPNLARRLRKVKGVPVVTGFIGRDTDGNVTTLGRSGSDYTATIVGRALAAEEVEIWTDVSGVLTADPRLVPEARPVEQLTYAEAGELAYYGAKVIHPATIQPAVEKGIPVRILNTMDPSAPGTVIVSARDRAKGGARVTSIASKSGISLVNIVSARMLGQSGFTVKVFDAFRRHDVIVDLIATSEVSITVSVDDRTGLSEAVAELRELGKVTVTDDSALIAVIGERMKQARGLAAQVFGAVGQAGVPIRAISYGATKTNLQLVVPQAGQRDAVNALHAAFFR
jgi:aspartate kinase